MKPDPSTFDTADDAADEAAMVEGEADIAAGRVIGHKAMKAWLLSWGTDDERPPPKACQNTRSVAAPLAADAGR